MAKNCFCSWSGGKDSCLSLYRSTKNGFSPKFLITMMTEDPGRSRSHGLSSILLRKQSELLDIPIIMKPTSWNDYEANFTMLLNDMKSKGIDYGIFGDIDLQEHLDWISRVTQNAGIKYIEPLWNMKRCDVVSEFLNSGFKAKIVACKGDIMDKKYLGMDLSFELLNEFESKGIDGAGENGEFHTLVYDGPIFKDNLKLINRDICEKDGYLFLDIEV